MNTQIYQGVTESAMLRSVAERIEKARALTMRTKRRLRYLTPAQRKSPFLLKDMDLLNTIIEQQNGYGILCGDVVGLDYEPRLKMIILKYF